MLSKLARTLRPSSSVTRMLSNTNKNSASKAPLWISLTAVGAAISIGTVKYYLDKEQSSHLFSTNPPFLSTATMMVSDEENGKENDSDTNKEGENVGGQDKENEKDGDTNKEEENVGGQTKLLNPHFAELDKTNDQIKTFNGGRWKIVEYDYPTAWTNLKKILKDKKFFPKNDEVFEVVLWSEVGYNNYIVNSDAEKLKIAKGNEIFTIQPKAGPPRRFVLLKDVEVWVVRVMGKLNGTKWSITRDVNPFVEIDEEYNVKTVMSFWPSNAQPIIDEKRFQQVKPLLQNMRKVIDSFILLDNAYRRYTEASPNQPKPTDANPKPGPSSKSTPKKPRRHSVQFAKISFENLKCFFSNFWRLPKKEEMIAECAPSISNDFTRKHLDEDENIQEILTRSFDQWLLFFSNNRPPTYNPNVHTKIPGVPASDIIKSYRDDGKDIQKGKFDDRYDWPSTTDKTKEGVLRWTSDPFKCLSKQRFVGTGIRIVYVPTCFLYLGMSTTRNFGSPNEEIIKNGTLDHLEEVWAYPISKEDLKIWQKEDQFLRIKTPIKSDEKGQEMPVIGFAELTKHFFEFENLNQSN